MTKLLAVGLATLLAVINAGCAAMVPATVDAPAPPALQRDEPELAERAFTAMAARCTRDPGDVSDATLNHCLAAANLATTVLHDAVRADAMHLVRCAKLAASGAGRPSCPPDRDGPTRLARK